MICNLINTRQRYIEKEREPSANCFLTRLNLTIGCNTFLQTVNVHRKAVKCHWRIKYHLIYQGKAWKLFALRKELYRERYKDS